MVSKTAVRRGSVHNSWWNAKPGLMVRDRECEIPPPV